MERALEIKFLEQLGSDDVFIANLSKCNSPEEAYNVAKKAGYNVSLDDFMSSLSKLENLLTQHSGELTENDLEIIAGGRSFKIKYPSWWPKWLPKIQPGGGFGM